MLGVMAVMRVLYVHSYTFEYRVRQPATKVRDEDYEPEMSLDNVLVVFVAVEEGDGDEKLARVVEDIADIAGRVSAKTVLLYPYAHLSNRLAPLATARELFNKLYALARERISLDVRKAPFGYYKEFKLHCIGHPLAELSRTF